MTSILIIDKKGTVKESIVKKFDEDMLYKKAGLKLRGDFKKQHTFDVLFEANSYSVSLFGKTDCNLGMVNKYEFPPPVDNVQYYGNCLLVRNDLSTEKPCDLTLKLWKELYSTLFGGFEDIENSDDEDDEDEDDNDIDSSLLTKDGYLKDDFVTEDIDISTDDDIESVEEKPVKKIKKTISSSSKKKAVTKKAMKEAEDDVYLGCVSELTAEEYFR